MKKFFNKMNRKVNNAILSAKCVIENRNAEGYVDTGVKVLIAVVLGALILKGLYELYNDVIDGRAFGLITSMFFYNG